MAFLAHQNYEEELLPKFVAAAASVTGRCSHTEASYRASHFEYYALLSVATYVGNCKL